MLASLYMSWNVMFPIFFYLLMGVFARKYKFVDEAGVSMIIRIVFHFFLPATIFLNIYGGDLSQMMHPDMLVLAGLVGLAVLLPVLVGRWYFAHHPTDIQDSAVMIQAMFRGNAAIFALPIVASLCGENQLGTLSLLLLCCSPLNNITGVITLAPIRQGKVKLGGALRELIHNPMILSCLCGLICLATGFRLPTLLEGTLRSFAGVTTPLSFVMLGASLRLSAFAKDAKRLGTVACYRLIINPAIVVTVAVALGYRGVPLTSLLAVVSAPTAVASFPMAKAYGGNGELAAELVATTTLFAALTVFLWIALAGYLGLI